MTNNPERPSVIDYEGSDYQTSFWDEGGREYEDQSEQIALKRLLPDEGSLLLEIGAGAGRNTLRYSGFQRVVLLDYSLTQLQQAQEYLGRSERYIYVAGDVYRLPFVNNLFDGSTMIRTLHHIQDPGSALRQVQRVLMPESPFILEYANKQNVKAILRFLFGKQDWNPFTHEVVEFVDLNFNFHPRSIQNWLYETGFDLEDQLTVSHFRLELLKRIIPTRLLVWLDSIFQYTGKWWQLSPSVFTRSRMIKPAAERIEKGFFQCPGCGADLIDNQNEVNQLACVSCNKNYPIVDGIYDFRDMK